MNKKKFTEEHLIEALDKCEFIHESVDYRFKEDQPLYAIVLGDDTVIKVGEAGVESITIQSQHGQVYTVPWAMVKTEADTTHINLALVQAVEELRGWRETND